MEIKKIILAVFIVISLNFLFIPINIYTRDRESIGYILNYRKENDNDEFINKNETKKLFIRVALTFQVMISNHEEL